MVNKFALCYTPILVSLLLTATGCFSKGNNKSVKISDPVSVYTTCAKNAGLDEKDTAALTRAIKHYDGEFTDEFKLSAMTVISSSRTMDSAKKDAVTKEYLSCVENSVQKK